MICRSGPERVAAPEPAPQACVSEPGALPGGLLDIGLLSIVVCQRLV